MERKIFLFSGVDSYSAEFIIRQLLDMDKESNEEITMFINSPGGYVSQMFAIIDTMDMIKSPIRTVVVGVAASAAAVIASSGDTRLIAKTAQYMLHEVSGFGMGNLSSMVDDLEQIKKQQDRLLNILSRNTGQLTSIIKDITNKTDKYFSADEAVAFGLCDRIIQDGEAQILKLSEGINVEGYEFSVNDKEVQILRDGKFVHPSYGEILITENTLNLLKANFDNKIRNIDISIDYTHANDNGESPAAFWIKSLEVRTNNDGKGKGLFAKGEFTPSGLKKIAEKEYKYSSADFVIDYIDETGKHHPYVLRGGTLTNRPFIKGMNPIKFSEYTQKESKNMNREELIKALKDHGIDVVSLQNTLGTSNAQIVELKNNIKELSALPAQKDSEIKNLKDELNKANQKIVDSEKLAAFNSLVEAGKVVPAQKEDILNTFDSSEKIAKFYANAPVVVNMEKKGSGGEGVEDTLTDAENELVKSGTYTKEQIIKNRKIASK